jgi:CRISPR/Cas system Type II protein with McrA/HNH and RuvC-like nuclease domain
VLAVADVAGALVAVLSKACLIKPCGSVARRIATSARRRQERRQQRDNGIRFY